MSLKQEHKGKNGVLKNPGTSILIDGAISSFRDISRSGREMVGSV